jgi:hypothetical protein
VTALYNEVDALACAVLRGLIADGLIAPGTVDGRSIRDIEPADLASVTQFHGFAGAGLWSDSEWLACADGKARRSKPGVRLLVDGMAGRAHLWRLAGNSIVPQLAAEVLRALKDEIEEREAAILNGNVNGP